MPADGDVVALVVMSMEKIKQDEFYKKSYFKYWAKASESLQILKNIKPLEICVFFVFV